MPVFVIYIFNSYTCATLEIQTHKTQKKKNEQVIVSSSEKPEIGRNVSDKATDWLLQPMRTKPVPIEPARHMDSLLLAFVRQSMQCLAIHTHI